MRCTSRIAGLAALALLVPGRCGADSPAPAEPNSFDEQTLKAAHLMPTGPGLLEFFRRRMAIDVEPGQLADGVRRLSDPAADVRDAAFGELVSRGAVAVAALRPAANSLDDLDAAGRARQCLRLVEGEGGAALVKAAARLLAQLQPAGTSEALLEYLPLAEDADTLQEIEQALAAGALRDGNPDPALRNALADSLPVRRAAAAAALCQAGGAALRDLVRPLLKDPRPVVRLRAALGLARALDAEAVPVLIDLLGELPPSEGRQAEEYLKGLAGEWAVATPPGAGEAARRLRRELWAAWWKAVDGPWLVQEFRRRTLDDARREQVRALIGRLGDEEQGVRDQALDELLAMGPPAAPLLHQAAEGADPRVRVPAGNCLRLLPREAAAPLPDAAARLLALRRPPGAAEAMLAYLPSAETEAIGQGVREALAALAVRDGEPNPTLRRALGDPCPARRAAAAEAFCAAGVPDVRAEVRRLLDDADPAVRLRVALALVRAHDRQAVPALIALLGELPPEQTLPAEEVLRQLAGDQAPAAAATGPKARDAWAAWWQEHGPTIDLARLGRAPRLLGLTLVVEQFDQNRQSNRVLEFDPAGKVRWQIEGLQYAADAQALPGDRVLVAEMQAGRVTERDRQGNVVWEHAAANPLSCRRLPGGQTFIAMRHQLLLVDRDGKETFTYQRPGNDIASAAARRDGRFALVTYQGQYVELDAAGKEVKSVRLPLGAGRQNFYHTIEFLPNDRLLLAMQNSNKVAEYDLGGKLVWEASVPTPTGVSRLPNGNTLVVSMAAQRVVEINRAGQPVWELKENIRPWKAYRR
jgi:HEAT repeat protein